MTLSISPVTAEDPAAIEALLQISEAIREHDCPDMPPSTLGMLRLNFAHPFPNRIIEVYVARLDGEPVGRIEISGRTTDNLNNLHLQIEVSPAYRRRGLGRAMHEFVLERARELQRTNLMAGTSWSLPGIPAVSEAGIGFATALGYASALPEVQRRLKLDTADPAALSELLARAQEKADGYRLVQWLNVAPEEYVADVAYLDSRLIEDAPMGDLIIEPEKIDAEKVRKIEELLILRGRRNYHTGVVHEASDSLVAWTTISTESAVPWHGWQQITIVEPKHRGHRLGALVKVENLRYFQAAEPAVTTIDTFNAAENSYMISINEEMGFRPLYSWQNWQREL